MSTIKTPFSYNVGINYESWTMGRDSRDIATDLTLVSQYFSLIKTFHCAGVGTTDIVMDPTQQDVINFVTGSSGQTLELIMGTNNSALAQGGYGTPWSTGLMTTSDYTDQWVAMLIAAFGDVATTLKHLKCICLGNEIDANGPPPTDSDFKSYYQTWIPSAFDNLKASLDSAGLGAIPVTTIIANYPLGDPSSNVVASSATAYVKDNWTATWNGGNSFVFFNQYTPDWGKSTDFSAVSTYFSNVASKLGGSPEVFVGETGYSAEYNTTGDDKQATVINAMFEWLTGQYNAGGLTTPLCVFQSFDRSAKPAGQQQMGLFTDTALKEDINIPDWVNKAIG